MRLHGQFERDAQNVKDKTGIGLGSGDLKRATKSLIITTQDQALPHTQIINHPKM